MASTSIFNGMEWNRIERNRSENIREPTSWKNQSLFGNPMHLTVDHGLKKKKVWHTALHRAVTMWCHLSPPYLPLIFLVDRISKPLPLSLNESYSWIVHFGSTVERWNWARHIAIFLKKSSLWERLRCWMYNFLFQKELAMNPFCLQVLRCQAFSSSANRVSFAHSALKAKDICLSFNWG